MSYTPTTWKDGDLVTSAKLNKIEQGIATGGGSGVPIIHATSLNGQPSVLDKTWQEIYDAGCGIIVLEENEWVKLPAIIEGIYYNNANSQYRIEGTGVGNISFITDDPNSYPYREPNNSDPGNQIQV